MSLYVLPHVGNAGLGNSLFPWARGELFARETKTAVLAPRWARVRLGPYLRREPEKRRYGSQFQSAQHIRGIRSFTIRSIARRLPEGQPMREYESAIGASWPHLVAFAGIGELFAPLLRDHDFISQKLWDMTRVHLRPSSSTYAADLIAVHVRRGDLTRQGFAPHELIGVKQYTPLSWFVGIVGAIKRIESLGAMPIVVFSDGSADELAALLRLDGVDLHRRQAAITDLWTMSRARILVASGFSTFGMWASFLGGMPTLYAPGKLQQCVQAGRATAMELEVAEGAEAVVDCLHRIFEEARTGL